jgi:hypothetical protein
MQSAATAREHKHYTNIYVKSIGEDSFAAMKMLESVVFSKSPERFP